MKTYWLSFLHILVAVVIFVACGVSAAQHTETVLHTFTFHQDGGFPLAGLSLDQSGNLYGVAYFGGYIEGSVCCGTVFQLTKSGNAWTFSTIYTFTDGVTDGEAPSGSVVFDKAGNLYGTTQQGGWCGMAYELTPSQKGPWKETILHNFNPFTLLGGTAGDGCDPSSYLIFDQAGNLYGTTQQGGGLGGCNTAGCGSVFELSPGSDGKWEETIIHSFPDGSEDGTDPYGGLVLDKSGNLWGTTLTGGTAGLGTIFELSPSSNGSWTEKVAFNFISGATGWEPYAGLVMDAEGNFYGTTFYGGSSGAGLVFKMTPSSDGMLSETVIHQFEGCTATECPDGFYPFGGLVFDSSGNLYGSTMYGGASGTACNPPDSELREGCGIVFKLSPAGGQKWDYSIVYRFPGAASGGLLTNDHLAITSSGDIVGTTFVEGDVGSNSICPQEVLGLGGCGVVFELTP